MTNHVHFGDGPHAANVQVYHHFRWLACETDYITEFEKIIGCYCQVILQRQLIEPWKDLTVYEAYRAGVHLGHGCNSFNIRLVLAIAQQ